MKQAHVDPDEIENVMREAVAKNPNSIELVELLVNELLRQEKYAEVRWLVDGLREGDLPT
ncbi:MAG: hypothetical protein E6G68_10625 [Actinobacteria bacterium]|nr:MAG: hypothetical protein E6G68_10625 [Actinomycetota bacterium]